MYERYAVRKLFTVSENWLPLHEFTHTMASKHGSCSPSRALSCDRLRRKNCVSKDGKESLCGMPVTSIVNESENQTVSMSLQVKALTAREGKMGKDSNLRGPL